MLRVLRLAIGPLFRTSGLFMLMVLMSACSDSKDPASGTREKTLDVSSARQITVDQYFSIYRYGDTLRFYHFIEQNAVLMLRFPAADSQFEILGSLNLFADSETQASISQWINNQHSDALVADAPAPTLEASLDASQYTITASSLSNTETATDGFLYHNYSVEFFIDNLSQGGQYHLSSFSDSVTVHVRRLPYRDLEVNSGLTETTTFSGAFPPHRYGNTLVFHHFTAENAVLKMVFLNDGSFEILASVNIFARGETAETIRNWITRQYSDDLGINAPQPEIVSMISQPQYQILSSTFLSSETTQTGISYDNYDVEFSFEDVDLTEVFVLHAFTGSTVVHVPIPAPN